MDLGLTFAQFLINCKQANQRWFPLRNTGFHITGIMVSYSKNIQLSLESHEHKKEHWIVAYGTEIVQIDNYFKEDDIQNRHEDKIYG